MRNGRMLPSGRCYIRVGATCGSLSLYQQEADICTRVECSLRADATSGSALHADVRIYSSISMDRIGVKAIGSVSYEVHGFFVNVNQASPYGVSDAH